jgi:hypothetical protein
MDPDSAVQPYSVMLSRVKHVYKLCFKQHVLSIFRLYHAVDLFVVGSVISNKSYHAVDKLVRPHA